MRARTVTVSLRIALLAAIVVTLVTPCPIQAYDIVQITDNAYVNYMPSLLQKEDGGLMIVFERLDLSFASGDLMLTLSDDGSVWTTPTAIVATAGNERHPSLVQLTDGSYQVYYLSDEAGGYRIHLATSPNGVSWTRQGIVDLGWSTESLVNPTVCRESDGSLTMTYDYLSNGGYIAHSADGVTWDHDRTSISTGALNRIMRHSDGTYVLSYQRKTGIWYYQIDIFTKTSADRVSWSAENRVTTNMNSHDSFPLELADGDYGLYYAVSNGGNPYDLVTRTSSDGSTWLGEDNWLPYSGWDTEPHPITLPSGVVALAWPRGPEQDETEICFVLLDPPTDIMEIPEEPLTTLSLSSNPFRGSVALSWTVPDEAAAKLSIYDVAGRLIRTYDVRACDPAPQTSLTWDGTDANGRELGSGVYFFRLAAGDHSATARAVLLK